MALTLILSSLLVLALMFGAVAGLLARRGAEGDRLEQSMRRFADVTPIRRRTTTARPASGWHRQAA